MRSIAVLYWYGHRSVVRDLLLGMLRLPLVGLLEDDLQPSHLLLEMVPLFLLNSQEFVGLGGT